MKEASSAAAAMALEAGAAAAGMAATAATADEVAEEVAEEVTQIHKGHRSWNPDRRSTAGTTGKHVNSRVHATHVTHWEREWLDRGLCARLAPILGYRNTMVSSLHTFRASRRLGRMHSYCMVASSAHAQTLTCDQALT